MIVLAFDIAYQTGWACGAIGGRPVWGHFGVECDGEEGLGRGLSHFARNFGEILAGLPEIDCLAWEMPIQASRHSAAYDEFVKGCTGMLRMTAFDHGWPALPCDMKAIRRHFFGAGTPHDAKQQVWMRCQTLGYRVKNTDESDAIACWDYACGVMKAREYVGSSEGFGGARGGKGFTPRWARGHRRL